MDESWHTHERVSHGTHMQGNIYMIVPKKKTATSHVTHVNESCPTHEQVMARTCRERLHECAQEAEPHTWTSHGTHMNESWHTHAQVLTHACREIST